MGRKKDYTIKELEELDDGKVHYLVGTTSILSTESYMKSHHWNKSNYISAYKKPCNNEKTVKKHVSTSPEKITCIDCLHYAMNLVDEKRIRLLKQLRKVHETTNS